MYKRHLFVNWVNKNKYRKVDVIHSASTRSLGQHHG